jgi:hypothetical protein
VLIPACNRMSINTSHQQMVSICDLNKPWQVLRKKVLEAGCIQLLAFKAFAN